MWPISLSFRTFFLTIQLVIFIPATGHALETGLIEKKTLPKERYLDAMVESVHQATVSAQTSGRINKIHFDVDDYVAKGNLLIEFRAKEQQAAFNAAKANLAQAEAEYQRIKDIYAQKLVAKAALDRANAAFRSAKARFEQAKEALEHTRVRAPYSGIVVKRHIELGENARVGQKLMTGLSLESLRAQVAIPQDMIHAVRQRKQASLILPNGSRIPAESMRISASADPASHTFDARIYLPKGGHGIYPGMFAKMAFVVGEHPGLLAPVKAVVQRSEVSGVYVIDDAGKVSFRQVRLGRRLNEVIEILAGLQLGEKVALDPMQAVVQLKQALEAQ